MDDLALDRRHIMKAAALGAAGMALAARPAAGGAQTRPGASRRMIIRADDIGMSDICNMGTFEAIDGGMITACDTMLDSPGTVDALERLRDYPWLSIGWHMHMWGAPVSNPAEVSSLMEKSGPFAGRFRTDLARAADVVPAEAARELRAQLNRCASILGKVPDTGGNANGTSPWGRAVRVVLDEFDIPYGFSSNGPTPASYQAKVNAARARGEQWATFYPAEPSPGSQADPRWADRKITSPAGTTAFVDLLTDSVAEVEAKYDPVLFYTEDRSGILKTPADVVTWQAWHPGYLDYYTYRLGERVNRPRAQQFVVGRVQDVAAMRDQRLRDWIRRNRIELVNFRDALYGTGSFQNHLRTIGSDLAVA